MAFPRRAPRVVGRRRETSWLEIEPVSTAVNNSSVLTHLMTAAELAKRPFTVVRTHLSVHVISDQLVASEIQVTGVGLCVVSDQAAAIGITAVPTPLTELESDLWFVNKVMITELTFGTAVGFDADAGRMFSIDSKAMRKVNDDEQIIIAVEGSGIGGGALITMAGRLLIKEH